MSFAHLKKTTHRIIAGFMAVWLSGVAFLFCCTSLSGAAKAADFCPLAKVKHCDHAKKTDATLIEPLTTQNAGECGLLPMIFDKVRKIEQGQTVAQPAAKVVFEPEIVMPRLAKFEPVRITPRIETRRETYLKHCNFRI